MCRESRYMEFSLLVSRSLYLSSIINVQDYALAPAKQKYINT